MAKSSGGGDDGVVASNAVLKRLFCELTIAFVSLQIAVGMIIKWFLFLYPPNKSRATEAISKEVGMPSSVTKADGQRMPNIDWQDSMLSYQSWRAICRSVALDIRKTVRPGGPAPNSCVVSLDGKQSRLLDFERTGRPLIIAFGSCT